MSGCTNCKGKAGCTDRKGDMFATLAETLAALYPTKTWGDLTRGPTLASASHEDLVALADELATSLDAATFLSPSNDDFASFIYVLALGRPPCGVQVRDLGVPAPTEWRPGDSLQEHYLRLCVSRLAPVAVVQQVAWTIDVADDGVWFQETARSGVFDAPFLTRMQRLVATLPAYGIHHFDFGELITPPTHFDSAQYLATHGHEAKTYNYLFLREPAELTSTQWLPLSTRHQARA